MTANPSRRNTAAALTAGALALPIALAGCTSLGSGEGVTLSFLVEDSELSVSQANVLADAFMEDHPDITVEIETRPGGADGDNLIKTRLATDEMNDLFMYNSGSLLQALNPEQSLVDLSGEAWTEKLDANFATSVSAGDGLYGAPIGQSMAGAVLYNKDVYADLGLEIPTTWDEFMSNNETIQAESDAAPVIQTYGDTWTSQLFVLGDFYNVLAADPDWADEYTANQAKFVDDPAFAGFAHLQEAYEAGLLNEDFASATYDDGVRMIATGEGAHYPMLTFAASPLVASYPEAADSVGTFPLPGPDGAANGLTVWMPGAVYIPQTTEGEQLDAAKQFMDFLTTPESCDLQSTVIAPQGPFVIDGCELPDDVPVMVSDMQPYFDEGRTGLALEFLSPVKGPALEQITVAVGSGITSAADGAAQYDEDVKKQAEQLGLEGW